jgi:CDP-glycerol glycerophosphotransferase
MSKAPPRTLRVRLLPDRLRLTVEHGPGRPVDAVGTALRGEPVDHWTPCRPTDDGRTAEIDLAALVARYPDDAVVDLWYRDEAGPDQEVEPRRLGRFPRTVREDPLSDLVVAGTSLRLRVNVHGNLGFLLGETVPPRRFAVDGTRLEHRDGVLSFEGTVTAFDRRLASVALTTQGRQSEVLTSSPMTVTLDPIAAEGLHGAVVHRFAGSLDLRELVGAASTDTLLDPRIVLTDSAGHVQSLKLHERMAVQGTLATASFPLADQVVQLVPRFTFLGGNLTVNVVRLAPDAAAALERMKRRPWWVAVARRTLGIWIVGEVPYKAQDNGYHLFRWIRRKRPLRLAYYVIDEAAPDRERVERLGRVVVKGSAKHVVLATCASRIVGTHHTEYLLPTPDPDYLRHVPAARVMLQHGILGTKNLTSTYGRGGTATLAADVFHVSSPRERAIVVEDLGFAPEQVRVTGLPRFDTLLAPPEAPPAGLLVIPTWRSRITSRQQFVESEFLARWRGFLTRPGIRALAGNGEQVSVILHPNMRVFADVLESFGHDVFRQGERDVQGLMREHAALVTDYSSVAFDFALQERPVFYFQFDREAYFRGTSSHLDLDAELPGPVFTDEEALAGAVVASAAAGFPMEGEYRERARRFFPAHDRNSSRRAYRSVRRARPARDR